MTPSDPVTLLVLDGDGISPEITAATLDVLDAVQDRTGLRIRLDRAQVGLRPLAAQGTTFPAGLQDRARAADGVILGPVSHNDYPPEAQGGINPSGHLRKHLDLFANIRPARSHPDFPARCGVPVDLVIVRENTEGFYADRTMFAGTGEFMPTEDVAIAMRKVTRQGSTRIAEAGFRIARQRGGRLTVVHKANVLRISDGLFLSCTRAVAQSYPDVVVEEVLVDAMAALLVRDASAFDTIVTTNMFGDILSDQATEIAGSIGLAASLNAGEAHAMAQAQHGSAPSIAGQDRANPASLINSTAMLLRWLGDRRGDPALGAAADLIEDAVARVIAVPAWRTGDLGGPLGTAAFAARIVDTIRNPEPPMTDDDLNAALAPTGALRVVINTGNAILTRPTADGQPAGISVDLARALAARRGLPLDLVTVQNAAASVAMVSEGRADLGFFAVDPARAATVAFTDPWVLIEGWYLVRDGSPITALDQVDRPGIRIAVGRGSAYDLHLSRTIVQASLERVTTSQEVVDFALREGFEVAAGIRQQLESDQRRHPGLRLLPERFMVIPQALGVPASRDASVVAALNAFLADARQSGLIADMMTRNATQGAVLP